MRRKLIKQGSGNGLAMYVPKDWTDKHSLKAGEDIFIEEYGDILHLQAKENRIKMVERVSLDVKDLSTRAIKNLIFHAYRQGYDSIKIKYTTQKQYEYIKKSLNTLLGFEITTEDTNSCVLENITEPDHEKFDVILRKLFITIKSDSQSIYEELESQLLSKEKRIEMREKADSYSNFCRRIVFKNRKTNDKSQMNNLEIIAKLTQIHHSYFYMLSTQNYDIKKCSKEMLNFFKQTTILFEEFYTLYYNHSIEKMGIVLDEIDNDKNILLNQLKSEDSLFYYYLHEIRRSIQLALGRLYGNILEDIKLDS